MAETTAFIGMVTPKIEEVPTTALLGYGKTLSDCTITGGKGNLEGRNNKDASAGESRSKTSREDNGTEKANYTVVFTPSETNIYLPVEFDFPVRMQIGVRVSCKADSRDYEKGNVTTTGTY